MGVAHAGHATCAHFSCFISEIERHTLTAVGQPFISRQHFYLHSVEFQCDTESFFDVTDTHTYVARVLTVCTENYRPQHQSQSQQCTTTRRSADVCFDERWQLFCSKYDTTDTYCLYCLTTFVHGGAAMNVTAKRSCGNGEWIFRISFYFYFFHFYLTETSTIWLWTCEIPRVALPYQTMGNWLTHVGLENVSLHTKTVMTKRMHV